MQSLFELPIISNPSNRLLLEDRGIHDWYRFVLSFPAHLVRDYLNHWDLQAGQTILDPFCGTGSTILEAKKLGFRAFGVDANAMAHFASHTKTDWSPDPNGLLQHARIVAQAAKNLLETKDQPYRELPNEAQSLLLTDSISPLPLHKALVLKECLLEMHNERFLAHELLALAKTVVADASNLRFGPEVGVSTKKKLDVDVIGAWLNNIKDMAGDLRTVQNLQTFESHVFHADARVIDSLIEPNSIHAVFTSPPYPNEKDYTRTTRLESVLLDFLKTKSDLKNQKQQFLRSNTRNVYKNDDDDQWVQKFDSIISLANAIENRRIELEKTSGFEKLYARVTKLYFGGIVRHLMALRSVLRPGAYLGYVVGDQASYLRVLIRTGQIVAEIAQSLGYELVSIDLFRTRFSTTTQESLREEVVVLRWRG